MRSSSSYPLAFQHRMAINLKTLDRRKKGYIMFNNDALLGNLK